MASSVIKNDTWKLAGTLMPGGELALPSDFRELLIDMYQSNFGNRSLYNTVISRSQFEDATIGTSTDYNGVCILWDGATLDYILTRSAALKLYCVQSTANNYSIRVYAR